MPAKKPAAGPRLYRVASPFVVRVGGVRQVFTVGRDVYAEDHPIVRKYPDGFEVVPINGVEAAVAAPGTVRNVTIPTESSDDVG